MNSPQIYVAPGPRQPGVGNFKKNIFKATIRHFPPAPKGFPVGFLFYPLKGYCYPLKYICYPSKYFSNLAKAICYPLKGYCYVLKLFFYTLKRNRSSGWQNCVKVLINACLNPAGGFRKPQERSACFKNRNRVSIFCNL